MKVERRVERWCGSGDDGGGDDDGSGDDGDGGGGVVMVVMKVEVGTRERILAVWSTKE